MQLLSFRNILIVGATAFALFMAYSTWNKADAGSFTGCNVGAAGSWNTAHVDDTPLGLEGPGVGALAGCDRAFGDLVIGAGGGYDFRRMDFGGVDVDSQGWQAFARAGVVVHEHTLVYALAGWSQVDADLGGNTVDLSGALVGGGLETALGAGWYGGLEYQRLLLDLDDFDIEVPANSFRASIKYKFGGPDPIIPDFTGPSNKPLK
jgi:opacity protein-like surface antigen